MSTKKDGVIHHITRSVKNLLVSGIKDIYHQAKQNAEVNHDVKMNIENLMKTSIKEAVKENSKIDDNFQLSEEELKNLILSAKDQVMLALKDDKSATEIRNELMGLDDLDDFEDEFEGLESNFFKLDEAFEDEEVVLDKTEITMYVLGFLNTQVKLDWFNNFIRDNYCEIKNLILSKYDYKMNNTVNYDPFEVDNLDKTLSNIDSTPRVIDSKSGKMITGTMEKGIGESLDFKKNSEDRCSFISKANTIENILTSIETNKLSTTDNAKFRAFMDSIENVINYYNNLHKDSDYNSNIDMVTIFKGNTLVSELSTIYDINKAINLYVLFYLKLVDYDKLEILKNSLYNILINK